MDTYTKQLSREEIIALQKRHAMAKVAKTPPYAYYQLRLSDCIITAYQSGKVVFQGTGAALYAGTTTAKPDAISLYPQMGSDEVGTGDYFGPVCVCAAYIQESDIGWLKALSIQDSKQVKDEQILKIAPLLMEKLPHSLLILNNALYNQVHEQHNMNAIKAQLHNQAYLHMIKKLGKQPTHIYLDQFTPEALYYRYLKQEPKVVKGITFETKAENKYLAVACGSIIARYAFLKSMDDMSEKYHFTFPKGAGKGVDEIASEFVSIHGEAELNKVAKVHFANTARILQKK